jgi:hypothetical protein
MGTSNGDNLLRNYLKTAENAKFAENLLLIYIYLSGLGVLCGEF